MAQDPYKYFRIEARELIDAIAEGVLKLEKGRTADVMARLLRHTHTLKGAARVVRQREIADLAHGLEDVLAPYREVGSAIPREHIDALLKSTDQMASLLADLDKPAPAALVVETQHGPSTSRENVSSAHVVRDSDLTHEARPSAEVVGSTKEAPQEYEAESRTVRADLVELDALVSGIAETHALMEPLRKGRHSLEQIKHLCDLLAAELTAPRGRDAGSANALSNIARSTLDEVRDLLGSVEREMATSVEHVDRELAELGRTAEELRLSPVSSMFPALERIARDTAKSLGKEVVFQSKGGEVRVDAHVLGEAQGALLQIVRNAVAHGIELPQERLRRGKEAHGTVTVEVTRHGSSVIFRGSDDGNGVDLNAVRRALQERSPLDQSIAALDTSALLDRLLDGGVSTAAQVSEVSGRGVGLDVVREAAKRLGGRATIRSPQRGGSVIELLVPLTVASIRVLWVESSDGSLTIPLSAVRHTARIAVNDIARTSEGESIVHLGKVIPFLPLSRALGERRAAEKRVKPWSAVMIQGSAGMAAIGVERLLGATNVVVRPLPALAPVRSIVSGASLDAEGNPLLVLDADALVTMAGLTAPSEEVREVHRAPILVIDDSLTTRMLEESILESAGYEVDTASSGEEGLEKAKLKHYSLFLVDVEMPGIDGFTFVERTRADAELRKTPAILVSSRAAPEDKARGAEVGAIAYIVKSEFNQGELLRRIENLGISNE